MNEQITCHTCTKPADQPYRRYDARGKCIEGCVDNFHTGHLITPSGSSRWHNRPEAKKIRARHKARMAQLDKEGRDIARRLKAIERRARANGA